MSEERIDLVRNENKRKKQTQNNKEIGKLKKGSLS